MALKPMIVEIPAIQWRCTPGCGPLPCGGTSTALRNSADEKRKTGPDNQVSHRRVSLKSVLWLAEQSGSCEISEVIMINKESYAVQIDAVKS